MQIKDFSIEEIIPYVNNPRNNKRAIPYVKKSIKQFGFKIPLVIDAKNVIVCGHTRYEAARQLGIKTLPCVIADDLTDEQIKTFRIVDNKSNEISLWDFEKLYNETEHLLSCGCENLLSEFDLNINNLDEEIENYITSKKEDDFSTLLNDEQKNDKDSSESVIVYNEEPEGIVCPFCGKKFNLKEQKDFNNV